MLPTPKLLPPFPRILLLAGVLAAIASGAAAAAPGADPRAHVPAAGPRSLIQAGREDAFRRYCLEGEGRVMFERLRADFDARYLNLPFPAEPPDHGDPNPMTRTSDQVDAWRRAQDTCGVVGGVAEAATLIWIVTREDAYFQKAREFLIRGAAWDVNGTTGVLYNDEAHFRLWRKLPLVYDRLRNQLGADERKAVLASFRARGNAGVTNIRDRHETHKLVRNRLEPRPRSHSVRFMAMTGLTGLALWDDLPEAKDWWNFAYTWYRDQFTPWGGDDGGWAEGPAYWRGVVEHASFQDALLAIGDPLAYSQPFWRQTGYFPIYSLQPYRITSFGDLSGAGKINMEPVIKDFLDHLARVTGDGYLRSWAALYTDPRPLPTAMPLELSRLYPTLSEYLIRNFISSTQPEPPMRGLAELPRARYFRDIGWVMIHSDLPNPDNDIHVTFKSSPYGSFSHSHADQNAFVINAYGRNLAVAAGYREYHRSPHHVHWTRQTISKNAILIDGQGQNVQDLRATGEILGFSQTDDLVWTAGDAAVAYNTRQRGRNVQEARRDLMFVENKFVVIRDRVRLRRPGRISWLLHAEVPMTWDTATARAQIDHDGASLGVHLALPGPANGKVTTGFPTPVDPKYLGAGYEDQWHLEVQLNDPANETIIWSVLWPDRDAATASRATITASSHDHAVIRKPDGSSITLRLRADGAALDR